MNDDGRALARLLLALAALLWALWPSPAWAVVAVDPAVSGYDLSEDIWLLEDPSGSRTIEDVTAPAQASRFERSEQRYPSLGLSTSAYWVRIELQNDADVPQERLLELVRGTLDRVEVHYPPGAEHRVLRSRRHAPFSERVYPHRYPVFPVTLPAHERVTLHIRVWTESELYFPIRLWSPDGFHEQDVDEHMLLAGYYGIVLALTLYHLFLFVRLRDPYLVYFALYISFIGTWMWFVDGLPFGQIESIAPRLGNSGYAITGGLGVSFALLFTQTFLDTRKSLPRMHLWLRAGQLYVAFVLVGHLFLSWRTINIGGIYFWLLLLPSMFLAGVLAWRKGVPEAGLFAVAWFVWLIGGVVAALSLGGVLAISPVEYLNPWRIAVLVEVVVMSLALAGRIQRLGHERAEAAALAVAQGQLVEAEKSVVLGRLMAGILHEMNTPLGALRSSADTLAKTFVKIDSRLGDDDKKLRRAVTAGTELTATIDASSARIAGVVDSLKRFVAVDEATTKRVDLRDGIEGALTLLAPSLEGIALERRLPEEPVMVLCSPTKLNHAILELMQRAVGAMNGEGTLRVELEQADEHVVLCIFDDGRISGDAEALFDFAFAEQDGHMRMKLGLPIAKKTITELGGTITVSDHEEGTRTKVTLPL